MGKWDVMLRRGSSSSGISSSDGSIIFSSPLNRRDLCLMLRLLWQDKVEGLLLQVMCFHKAAARNCTYMARSLFIVISLLPGRLSSSCRRCTSSTALRPCLSLTKDGRDLRRDSQIFLWFYLLRVNTIGSNVPVGVLHRLAVFALTYSNSTQSSNLRVFNFKGPAHCKRNLTVCVLTKTQQEVRDDSTCFLCRRWL